MIVQTNPSPRARRADPITSHLAAQSARPLQMTHLEQILAALQQQGLASPTGKLGLSVCGRLEREWEAV